MFDETTSGVDADKAEPTVHCCDSCQEPLQKYFSVDTKHGFCGECCMDPKYFWLYKIFEPTLDQDLSTNSPCSDREYTEYQYTPTHGVWPVTMTLDLYGPKSSDVGIIEE